MFERVQDGKLNMFVKIEMIITILKIENHIITCRDRLDILNYLKRFDCNLV